MLRNGFAFLIAWEIMTLSSLMLVMFDHNKANTLQAGLNYLVQMHIGVAFLTIAFIWVFVAQQTSDFQGIATFLQPDNDVLGDSVLFYGIWNQSRFYSPAYLAPLCTSGCTFACFGRNVGRYC